MQRYGALPQVAYTECQIGVLYFWQLTIVDLRGYLFLSKGEGSGNIVEIVLDDDFVVESLLIVAFDRVMARCVLLRRLVPNRSSTDEKVR